MRPDQRRIDRVLSRPWTTDDLTFSDRIWKQKTQLLGKLQTELTQSFLRGTPPQKTIDNIKKEFGVTRYQAGRLVMTESAFFASAAQKDCYNDLGVERYEIVATLDSLTSQICQDMDGEIAPMSEYEEGVTAPPFHPNCRTCTVPYFDDNFGERAARDADGEVYYVPSNMNYKEWKSKYAKDAARVRLTNAEKYGIINISDVDHVLKSSQQHYLKHIEGTSQFERYLQARIENNKRPQSIISISEVEVQKIIREYSGKGVFRGKKEYIALNKNIGKYHNGDKYVSTKAIEIHHGLRNAHIVPVREKK